MAVDPSVIAALLQAVEADPANRALRLHLAGLMVEAGDPDGARSAMRAHLSAAQDRYRTRLASQQSDYVAAAVPAAATPS